MKTTAKGVFWVLSVLLIIVGMMGLLLWRQWQFAFFILAGLSIVPPFVAKIQQKLKTKSGYNIIASCSMVLVAVYITTIATPITGIGASSDNYDIYISSSAESVPLASSIPGDVIPDELVVHFLDVGQADSTLIQLPNGETMLIDGGNQHNSITILNYMKDLEITTIDHLIITHPHADHIGGLPAIIESMEIKNIYMPRVGHTTLTYERLSQSINKKDLRTNEAGAGVEIVSESGLHVIIVGPVRNDYRDLNDHSIVLKLTYGITSFLFTGDAGSISKEHITADISADVLKVSQHGSNTATSEVCLKRIAPIHAVISVGEDNNYGHPCDTVLARLDDAGVEVHRTDLLGTVVFTSDGKEITLG